VINLLCDRALRRGLRFPAAHLDGPLIQTAAHALDREQAAEASAAANINATARSTQVVPVEFRSGAPCGRDRRRRTKAVQRVTSPSLWRSAARAGLGAAPRFVNVFRARGSLAFGAVALCWAFVEPDRRGAQAPPSVAAPLRRRHSCRRATQLSATVAKAVTEAAATTGTPKAAGGDLLRLDSRGRRDRNRRALRYCGGVLSDRHARLVRGGRSYGARSADAPTGLGRLDQVISGPFASRADARTRSTPPSRRPYRHADCAAERQP